MFRIRNVHERHFVAPPDQVGMLVDALASRIDRLWPSSRWPRMQFDRPLQVGAIGGHGPIRYRVDTCEPGKRVVFRLQAPRGFDGSHGFEVEPRGERGTTLRHILDMNARGPAMLTWPLLFGPLHDALVADCLDCAAAALGEEPQLQPWSLRVRLLRRGYRLLARPQR